MSGHLEPPDLPPSPRGGEQGHPAEALAGYVDGTATASERTLAERHLADCASCRADVDAARRGFDAMLALPEAAPAGLAATWRQAAAIEPTEAVRPSVPTPSPLVAVIGRRRGLPRGRLLIAGVGLGAAAAVVALLVVFGSRSAPPSSTSAGPATGGRAAGSTSGSGYDGQSLESYAQSLLPLAERSLASPHAGPSTDRPSAVPAAATSCATRLIGLDGARLLASKQALFQGKPAWILAYIETPTSAPHLVMIVVPTTGCSLYFYSRLPIPSG